MSDVAQGVDWNDTQRRHFNRSSVTCKAGRRPQCQWNGVWFIECERGAACSCRVTDGDNYSPARMLLSWAEKFERR